MCMALSQVLPAGTVIYEESFELPEWALNEYGSSYPWEHNWQGTTVYTVKADSSAADGSQSLICGGYVDYSQ